MKRPIIGLFALSLIACGGGEAAKKDSANNATAQGVVAACDTRAADARAAIERASTVNPSMASEFSKFYSDWRTTFAAWDADDHPCLMEGAGVMDRLATHKEVARELEEADDSMQNRIAPAFVSKPDAVAFFDVLFAGGDKPADKARRAAFNVAKVQQNAHFEAFGEHGWATLDADGTTTCTTSSDPIDPTGDVKPQMLNVFESEIDVHVLCRLPVDAASFGGDEGGQLTIELTKSNDWKSDPVTAVELGKPEKWGKTRFFTARFRVPLKSTRNAETYRVNLVARRPTMGDEKVVGTSFWWFR
jgi:hypothetical protein